MRLPLLAAALSLLVTPMAASDEAPVPAEDVRSGALCHLKLLADPAYPGNPRIALLGDRNAEGCESLVLDTGYRLSAVQRPRDRKRLERGEGPFSCVLTREPKEQLDWEAALLEILAPGFRGEALLHLGRVDEAMETFFRGLPDSLCEVWLAQAARNLPGPVAERLPQALRSRNAGRAGSALEVLGALVSSHPSAARDAVEVAMTLRRGRLRPRALQLAGEEAAGLRAGGTAPPGADALTVRIEEALADHDPAVRGAAAGALLLAGPDAARTISLLAGAAEKEKDAATRPLILAALAEAGGTESILRLSRSTDPELRRDALRAAAGMRSWPAGEPDPVSRLLREEPADPGQAVLRMESRRGDLPAAWAPLLGEFLPALNDRDLARVPGILCRIDDTGGEGTGLSVLLEMSRTRTRGAAVTAALSALGDCGAGRREESLALLLEAARDPERDEAGRMAAAVSAARLAEASESYDQVLAFFRDALESQDEISRGMALAGLARLGHWRASPPATLLAPIALESPAGALSHGAGEALRSLFDTAPGPVTEVLRALGARRSEEEQEKVFLFFRNLKPEKRERILQRWRSEFSDPGKPVDPAVLSEMESLADYWPDEILALVQPSFEAAGDEERIRMLDLMVALGRLLPNRILPLLTLPEGVSMRLREATREARAATMARGVLAEPGRGPGDLTAMALDPADSERRETGRLALWLLAWESLRSRSYLVPWAREARRTLDLPRRVELGRWLGQVSEMKPRKFPVSPEARQEPRKARFLPGTSGDSEPAP